MKFDIWLLEHPEWQKSPDLVISPPTVEEVSADYPEVDVAQYFTDDGRPYMMKRSGHVTLIAQYYLSRLQDSTHAFADMCAQQRGPALMTDSVFFEGNKRLGDNYVGTYRDALVATAAKHGFTSNYQYHPGLARWHPEEPQGADPEAYVPPSGGRSYIRNLCEKRGWACEGAVEVSGRSAEKDPFDDACSLAPDLVAANAQRFAQKNPDEARKMSRKDLRDHMVTQHGVND